MGASVVVNPVNPNARADNRELLKAGLADGVLFPQDAIVSFGLDGVVKYATLFPDGLFNFSFGFVMVKASGLADRFEAVLSVDEAKVFKPDQRVYRLVEQRCGVKPDKVCFLSSNCWDAHGAAHFGFATVWVNRARAPDDNLPGKTVAEINDLSQLPSLLGVS